MNARCEEHWVRETGDRLRSGAERHKNEVIRARSHGFVLLPPALRTSVVGVLTQSRTECGHSQAEHGARDGYAEQREGVGEHEIEDEDAQSRREVDPDDCGGSV